MAKTGGGAAYQRLKGPGNEISQSLQYWGGIAARENQERRSRQEREKVRNEQRQDRMADQMVNDISSVQPVITGIKSVDEINYRATSNAQKRIGDIYRKMNSDPSLRNDTALRMELSNLKSFPKTLSQIEGKLKEYTDTLTKGYADGSISKWDEDKLDELEAFYGVKDENGNISPNYIVDFNESGNMIAKGITKDGKYFEKSINDVMNGYEYSSHTEAINAQEHTKSIAESLGKKQQFRISNGFSSVVQDFSSQEEAVRGMVRSSLGSEDDPSDIAKSIWSDEDNMGKSKSDFNEGSIKEIEDYLVSQVEMKYDRTITAKQLRKESSDKPKTGPGSGNIQIMRDASSGEPIKSYLDPNTKNMYAIGFSLAKPVTTGVGNKEKKINRLYLDGKGDILYKGEEAVRESSTTTIGGFSLGNSSKEIKFKEITGGGLNSEELNVIANRLGYENASNLRSHLEDMKSKENISDDSRGILD